MTSVYVYTQTNERWDKFWNEKVQETLVPFTFTSENCKKRVQFFSSLAMTSVYVYTQTYERRDNTFLKKVQKTLISFMFTTENFKVSVQFF